MSQKKLSGMAAILEGGQSELLIEEAKNLARELKRKISNRPQGEDEKKATSTQVRRLFATLRQIEHTWSVDQDQAYRELLLFGPRLAYQAHNHPGIRPLALKIQEAIQMISQDKDRNKVRRLVEFYEATVAYFIAGPESGGV